MEAVLAHCPATCYGTIKAIADWPTESNDFSDGVKEVMVMPHTTDPNHVGHAYNWVWAGTSYTAALLVKEDGGEYSIGGTNYKLELTSAPFTYPEGMEYGDIDTLKVIVTDPMAGEITLHVQADHAPAESKSDWIAIYKKDDLVEAFPTKNKWSPNPSVAGTFKNTYINGEVPSCVDSCTDTCEGGIADHVSDDACDDGGSGSEYSYCNFGTDCTDCGNRCEPAALKGKMVLSEYWPKGEAVMQVHALFDETGATNIFDADGAAAFAGVDVMSFAQLQELRGVELVAIKFSSENGKPKFDVQHQSAPFVLPEIKDDFNDWGEERYVRCLYHNKKCEAARRGDGSMISRICDVSPNPPPAPPAGPASCSAAEHMGLHFDLRTFFDSHLSDDTAAAIKGSSGPHCKDISSKAFKSYILEGHFNRLDLWPGGPQDGTGKVQDSDFAKGEVKNSELGPCAQWAGLCHESNLNADGSYKDNTGYYTPAEMMAVRAHCPVTCSTLSWKDICNAAYMTDGYYFGGCKVNEHKQTCVSTYDIEEQCFFIMSADMTAPLYDDATRDELEALFGGCTESCEFSDDGECNDGIASGADGAAHGQVCPDGPGPIIPAGEPGAGEPSCDLLENGNCDFGSDCTDCGIRGTQSWPDWAETFTAPDDQIAKVWKGVDLELEGHDSAHLCEPPADAPHFEGVPHFERVTPTGDPTVDSDGDPRECDRD